MIHGSRILNEFHDFLRSTVNIPQHSSLFEVEERYTVSSARLCQGPRIIDDPRSRNFGPELTDQLVAKNSRLLGCLLYVAVARARAEWLSERGRAGRSAGRRGDGDLPRDPRALHRDLHRLCGGVRSA